MMRLTPPKKIVFWIALLLAVVGVVFFFVSSLSAFAIWFVLAGYLLLAAGNALKGF